MNIFKNNRFLIILTIYVMNNVFLKQRGDLESQRLKTPDQMIMFVTYSIAALKVITFCDANFCF